MYVADANMEKGEMRVEANISVGKGRKLGVKVEIKNLNSFKAIGDSVDYEREEQRKAIKHKAVYVDLPMDQIKISTSPDIGIWAETLTFLNIEEEVYQITKRWDDKNI